MDRKKDIRYFMTKGSIRVSIFITAYGASEAKDTSTKGQNGH